MHFQLPEEDEDEALLGRGLFKEVEGEAEEQGLFSGHTSWLQDVPEEGGEGEEAAAAEEYGGLEEDEGSVDGPIFEESSKTTAGR